MIVDLAYEPGSWRAFTSVTEQKGEVLIFGIGLLVPSAQSAARPPELAQVRRVAGGSSERGGQYRI